MDGEVPFSEYAEVNPKRSLRSGEAYPFLEMAAVPEGGGAPRYFQERIFDGAGSRFQAEDTLFARITPCTENGKMAFVTGLNGSSLGFGSTELIVLSAREGKADARFIYQVAASERVRQMAVARMLGTSGRQRVPTWFFEEELTIPVFDLPEQRAIAAVLDAIDEAIEQTEAVIAATETLRKSLLHDLLTRGVPSRHTQWKHVPGIGTIPACWEVVRLGEVAEVTSGLAMGPNRRPGANPRPYLTVAHVHTNRVSIDQPRYMEASAAEWRNRSLEEGDIVLVEGHAQVSQLGRAALVPKAAEGFMFQNHLFRVRPLDGHDGRYITAFINGSAGRAYFSSFAGTTSGLNTVSTANVKALRIPVPSSHEQNLIGDSLSLLDSSLNVLRTERIERLNAKVTVAKSLLTGQVRVRAVSGVVE